MKRNKTDDRLIKWAMRRALQLARRGEGWTSPNPMVGAVLLKDGRVIGEGYHHAAGLRHAEIEALNDARRRGNAPAGSVMVVNLEPCCHHGRTPPCTDALVEEKVAAVYVAHQDINPLVCGNGIRCLEEKRIEVHVGLLAKEAIKLNEAFCKWALTNRPFVVLKAASTLDGKIATASGHSQWVSGEKAREFAHRLRHRYDAVMVGVDTVIADDPQLTCRLLKSKKCSHPLRVIVDSTLRIPPTAQVVSGKLPGRTLIATTDRADQGKAKKLEKQGVTVEAFPATPDGKVDLTALTETLGTRDITSVLVEGGGRVLAACLSAGIADKLSLVLAPKIAGGAGAITSFEGELAATMDEAHRVLEMTTRRLGEDILIEGYF
ncbi:MAG: bifunctional diaminohydroxyphosphoribosylaminopyrimidine deaminase/5-amino-6-(5-phosphoribosylamino)uracil reductase RibD [Alphaproteobacteria bacterium]